MSTLRKYVFLQQIDEYIKDFFDKITFKEKIIFYMLFIKSYIHIWKYVAAEKKAVIYIGVPGTGKSTLATEQCKSYYSLDVDKFREPLFKMQENRKNTFTKTKNFAFLFYNYMLKFLILHNYNFVITYGLTSRISSGKLKKELEIFKQAGYQVEIIVIDNFDIDNILKNIESRTDVIRTRFDIDYKISIEKINHSIENIKYIMGYFTRHNINYKLIENKF